LPSHSKLYLVDLAGSENIKRSGAEGTRQKEAGEINKSLCHLKSVIEEVFKGKRVSTYRCAGAGVWCARCVNGSAAACSHPGLQVHV
jgi:hypothetical protein